MVSLAQLEGDSKQVSRQELKASSGERGKKRPRLKKKKRSLFIWDLLLFCQNWWREASQSLVLFHKVSVDLMLKKANQKTNQTNKKTPKPNKPWFTDLTASDSITFFSTIFWSEWNCLKYYHWIVPCLADCYAIHSWTFPSVPLLI